MIEAAIRLPSSAGQTLKRANACLALYFDPDQDDETRKAVRASFARSLKDFPAWAMHRAFDKWERTSTRRPSPGDIVTLAHREIEPYTAEIGRRNAIRASVGVAVRDRPVASPEARARILAEFGFTEARLNGVLRREEPPEERKHPLDGLPPDHPEMQALRRARARAAASGGGA